MLAVDHRGEIVDGDQIIALCATDLQSRGRLADDTVVVTVMSNLGFRTRDGDGGAISVVDTKVGDRYVLEALADGGYSLGGEQSGHIIFTDHGTTGDGILSAVVLADLVARSGRPSGGSDGSVDGPSPPGPAQRGGHPPDAGRRRASGG